LHDTIHQGILSVSTRASLSTLQDYVDLKSVTERDEERKQWNMLRSFGLPPWVPISSRIISPAQAHYFSGETNDGMIW